MFRQIFEIAKYYRVNDWIHYLGYTLISSILLSNIKLINFVLSAIILAYAYSLNDYYDKKMKNKYFLVPLLLYWLIVPFISYFSFIISLSFLFLFTLYSWPKVWLEGKPILSTFSNAIGFTLIFILPFDNIERISNNYQIVLLIFSLNIIAQLLHEISHFKNDKNISKITTSVKIGLKKSTALLKIIIILTLIYSISFVLPKYPIFCLYLCVFLILFLSRKKITKNERRDYKNLGILGGIILIIEIISVK
jgi:4-hydroxybenzoate polyprenyltransferase